MTDHQSTFKRYEVKYLISRTQREMIKNHMKKYMSADIYGRSSLCNIYFDTPDYLLIRRSLDHPIYKEKLRLRSYGIAAPNSNVFIEIKKKYEAVVYKRRAKMAENEAMRFLLHEDRLSENKLKNQILKEINYVMEHYENLKPKVFLSYDREAYFGKNDKNFRITFDENILWRDYDLSMCSGIYGESLLPKNQILMEIKAENAIPMWMTALLSQNHIYKTKFSKYGNAYKSIFYKEHTGDLLCKATS